MALSPSDPNSHSRPDLFQSVSLHFDWDIDFDAQKVVGEVQILLRRQDDGKNCRELVLDVNMLTIDWVQAGRHDDPGKKKLEFSVGPPGSCGSRLDIRLPEELDQEDEVTILIRYSTSPQSPALLWLSPEQTSGGDNPFVFSQGQAILNRALFPCQDTPAVKTPYTATVRAPAQLTVLMSALSEEDGPKPAREGRCCEWTFRQPIAIPSYLVAFAVGDLESRDIGPRSRVFAEKEHIERAAFDFSETEAKLRTAEELCGPYLWSRYDILVLPPSFAYGGMENPCLTFVTPTLLTGDKSNTWVIAHEIAHSWTGNLITNSNWEHFWLNEGFTVFIERKIAGRLDGDPVRHFNTLLKWHELEECVNEEFSPDHEFTKLVPNLIGVDPDDAFCRVPYEKGSTFLWYLEELVGGPSKFEPFLKSYFTTFAHKSLDTAQFRDYFLTYYKDTAAVTSIDWATWLHSPGMPPYKPSLDTSMAAACWSLADKWVFWDQHAVSDCDIDISSLSPPQVQEFLSTLIQKPKLKPDTVAKMDELYQFSSSSNCNILYGFLRLGLKCRWEPAVELSLRFLGTMGRLHYTKPLYRELARWPEKKPVAAKFFNDHKHLLMSAVVDAVSKDLN